MFFLTTWKEKFHLLFKLWKSTENNICVDFNISGVARGSERKLFKPGE